MSIHMGAQDHGRNKGKQQSSAGYGSKSLLVLLGGLEAL
uniref:Uncharacterized protein n=1 Tax=Arundo donax TaxID=35708 RepID=A0A0A8YFW4_ARUDO